MSQKTLKDVFLGQPVYFQTAKSNYKLDSDYIYELDSDYIYELDSDEVNYDFILSELLCPTKALKIIVYILGNMCLDIISNIGS